MSTLPHIACSQNGEAGTPAGSPVPIEQRLTNLENRMALLETSIANFSVEISHRVTHIESEQTRFNCADFSW